MASDKVNWKIIKPHRTFVLIWSFLFQRLKLLSRINCYQTDTPGTFIESYYTIFIWHIEFSGKTLSISLHHTYTELAHDTETKSNGPAYYTASIVPCYIRNPVIYSNKDLYFICCCNPVTCWGFWKALGIHERNGNISPGAAIGRLIHGFLS